MFVSRPFKSDNEELNQLIEWIIRNFAAKNDTRKSIIQRVTSSKDIIRDGAQEDGEIRYRLYEDALGTFLQPIIQHNGKIFPLPAYKQDNGQQRFMGEATTWDDFVIPALSARLAGANPADVESYKDSYVLSFDSTTSEYAYFILQLPHAWQQYSDIEFHIHWTPKTSGAAGGAENVKWDFTYSWANINGSFPASSSLTATRDVQNDSADDHLLTEIGTLAGQGKTMSSIALCSLKRDTGVADNYGDEAYLVSLDFHLKKDTHGSDHEYDK